MIESNAVNTGPLHMAGGYPPGGYGGPPGGGYGGPPGGGGFGGPPGGGGYGNPAERDPTMVVEDVAEGYVSAAAAREYYGIGPAEG